MHPVFAPLLPADYRFLVEVIEGPIGLTDDRHLHGLLRAVEADDTPEARRALALRVEHELRYLGSADLAYLVRYATGKEAGVPLREVVRDVAKKLKVDVPMGTEREMLEALAEGYATQQFAGLPPEEQQALLERLGVEQEQAAAFLKKSAGVFAIPALIQAFGIVVVDGLIKTVLFGAIAKIIGAQFAARLFQMLMARLPWWVGWIGPAAWSLSISWAVLDVQGPAYRKTIPAMLYLGLCSLRERAETPAE
ncbi:MAG: hypothetical protein R3247_03915 [Rhodothermales bacterium]|nr:hypothetical protein [Rhodothermales bacterium]